MPPMMPVTFASEMPVSSLAPTPAEEVRSKLRAENASLTAERIKLMTELRVKEPPALLLSRTVGDRAREELRKAGVPLQLPPRDPVAPKAEERARSRSCPHRRSRSLSRSASTVVRAEGQPRGVSGFANPKASRSTAQIGGIKRVMSSHLLMDSKYKGSRANLHHVDKKGVPLDMGPGYTPIGAHDVSFEFYVEREHQPPTVRTKFCGAVYHEWAKEAKCQPVSSTTLHIMRVDWRVPPLDLITEALKISEVLGVEITAFHYCRYDSDCKTHAHVAQTTDPKFMQPHKAGVYIAIKPGCPDKLIAMVDLLDGLVFKVGEDVKDPISGEVKYKVTSECQVQLSTKELVAFEPTDPEYYDRRLVDGPLYGSELKSGYLFSDFYYYPYEPLGEQAVPYRQDRYMKGWNLTTAKQWVSCEDGLKDALETGDVTHITRAKPRSAFDWGGPDKTMEVHRKLTYLQMSYRQYMHGAALKPVEEVIDPQTQVTVKRFQTRNTYIRKAQANEVAISIAGNEVPPFSGGQQGSVVSLAAGYKVSLKQMIQTYGEPPVADSERMTMYD